MNRRNFFRMGASGAFGFGHGAWAQGAGAAAIIIDSADAVAAAPEVRWAAVELESALQGAGYTVRRLGALSQLQLSERAVLVFGSAFPSARTSIQAAGVSMPADPESLALLPVGSRGQNVLATAPGPRGLVYAVLELADRVRSLPRAEALRVEKPVVERPANRVRGVMRQFNSEALDKPWFYDREMWPQYLKMLATQRVNRFNLTFGLGYDSLDRVADSYLMFIYPFLLAVPGYDVRATNLPDSERARNLATLRYISEQTAGRGIEFELGIWMHGYRMGGNSTARYAIEGITPENHARYCRDALTALLRACPAISSVGLRIHGESGIAEGSYEFWRTIFDGAARCGRKVELDLHAKGIDATMIDGALATGLPVNISPKLHAEHLGMPYHQAAIRDLEMPVAGRSGAGLMTLSEGSRSHTRYGYSDLMREDRKYTVRHRVFAGTQRLLLWGDPEFAAATARGFGFCGSAGADLMEPLTCRGRRGSAAPGIPRTGYADARLEPRWDWQKYEYWYRVWGRTMYNPATGADVWARQLGAGGQGSALRSALASASRILPIVTMAHLPSAACDAYWPEVYWNQPMAEEPRPNPYGDSPAPRTFQNASPLDPQIFSRISDFAAELIKGERSGKYSPVEVAQWLEDLASAAEKGLTAAGELESAALSGAAIDVALQAGLGRFFAAKLRAGVLYSLHEQTGDRGALEEAIKLYRVAREAWAQVTARAKGVYAADLSPSDRFSERGQWADRLPGIDQDIAALEARLAKTAGRTEPGIAGAVREARGAAPRTPAACRHRPPASFHANADAPLSISVENGRKVAAAKLYYRHVNQAERWESVEMAFRNDQYEAAIPAAYTASPYSLQYYFELRESPQNAWLYPGFTPALTNQPYFVLRPA
jgi:hypothetical protein